MKRILYRPALERPIIVLHYTPETCKNSVKLLKPLPMTVIMLKTWIILISQQRSNNSSLTWFGLSY